MTADDAALSAPCPHGAAIDKLDEELILYPARAKALSTVDKRIWWAAVPCAIITLLLQILLPFNQFLIPFGIIAFTISYLLVRRRIATAMLPITQIRSNGIEIHSYQMDIFIPWSEIKEVRAYKDWHRRLGIVPFDLKRTLEKGSTRTKIFAWSNEADLCLYRMLGMFAAPLNISEFELPLSADEVAELINVRRDHHATKLSNPTDFKQIPQA